MNAPKDSPLRTRQTEDMRHCALMGLAQGLRSASVDEQALLAGLDGGMPLLDEDRLARIEAARNIGHAKNSRFGKYFGSSDAVKD